MKQWEKFLLVAFAALIVLGAIGCVYWHQRYPYGKSHCCDVGLSVALRSYAGAHAGRFPSGESSPEASLSLLYREHFINATILRGKTVPESQVVSRLEAGQLLSPALCGWHYVEGLRSDANPRLALFWDKVGLGHNGERLAGGGHTVWFVTGQPRLISASEWQRFLSEQQTLLATHP